MSEGQLKKIKSFPSVYLKFDEDKRKGIESKAGVIRSSVFNQLNNTDCLDYFHESIQYELKQAKKLSKIRN